MLARPGVHLQTQNKAAPWRAAVLAVAKAVCDPRHEWRGFFVRYVPFYFYYFGYRQRPTCAGATIMPG